MFPLLQCCDELKLDDLTRYPGILEHILVQLGLIDNPLAICSKLYWRCFTRICREPNPFLNEMLRCTPNNDPRGYYVNALLVACSSRGWDSRVELLLRASTILHREGHENDMGRAWVSSYGHASLVLAALNGHVGVVSHLLSADEHQRQDRLCRNNIGNADPVNIRNEALSVALCAAASRGHVSIVDMLLSAGADAFCSLVLCRRWLNYEMLYGMTAMMLDDKAEVDADLGVRCSNSDALLKTILQENVENVNSFLNDLRHCTKWNCMFMDPDDVPAIPGDDDPANNEDTADTLNEVMDVARRVQIQDGNVDEQLFVVDGVLNGRVYEGISQEIIPLEYLLKNRCNLINFYHRESIFGARGAPLILAALHGHVMVMERVLSVATNCMRRTLLASPPLSSSASSSSHGQRDPPYGSDPVYRNIIAKYGLAAAACFLPLRLAARYGHVDAVNCLLASVASLQQEALKYPAAAAAVPLKSMVHLAVQARHSEALWRAARWGHASVVRVLLDAGADASARDGLALLHASQLGHVDTVRTLLFHSGVGCTSRPASPALKNMALRRGVRSGHANIVACLLRAGADPYSVDYRTLCASADLKSYTRTASIVLHAMLFADWTRLSNDYLTLALRAGDVRFFSQLRRLMASEKNRRVTCRRLVESREKQQQLLLGVLSGQDDLVAFLLSAGVDPYALDVMALNAVDDVRLLKPYGGVIIAVLRAMLASPTRLSNDHVELAARVGDVYVLSLMIQSIASRYMRRRPTYTYLLIRAARDGHAPIIRYLMFQQQLQQQLSTPGVQRLYNEALTHAAMKGHSSCVELLLHDAASCVTPDGVRMALVAARSRGRFLTARLLQTGWLSYVKSLKPNR